MTLEELREAEAMGYTVPAEEWERAAGLRSTEGEE